MGFSFRSARTGIALCLSLWVWIWTPALFAEERPVLVLDDRNEYSLKGLLEFLEDPAGELTFADVQQPGHPGFVPTTTNTPGFGFTDSTFWSRLRIRNPGPDARQVYLEIVSPSINEVHYRLLEGQEILRESRTGYNYAFDSREIHDRNYVFRIKIPPGQERLVLFRFRSAESMILPIVAFSEEGYAYASQGCYFLHGAYFGLIAVMVIYNLILYFSYRDPNYVYYVLYIVCFLGIQSSFGGFVFQYVIPEHPEWNRFIPKFSTGLTAFWAIVFCRSFLSVRRYSRGLDNVLIAWLGLSLGLCVFVFFDYDRYGALATNFIGLSMSLLMLAAGVYVLWRGYHPARYFLLAFSMLIAGAVLLILMFVGVLPGNFLTRYGLQIGSALEMILLSLGLRDRIITMRHEREADERRFVAARLRMLDSFSRFVPRQFLEHLQKENLEDVAPGDAVREEITVLFNDLRGFTALSETLSVEENFRFINEYARFMQPAISANNGFIDKFIGDAIMALFPRPDDALRAALEMRGALARFNERRGAEGHAPVEMSIGLNTGELMLGTVGTANRMDTTVIGDTVNLASRLESLTRRYGVSILISEFVHAKLREPERFMLRELDLVRVKGKQRPVRVYELMGLA